MRFFVNKYPVSFGNDKDGKPIIFEVGTVFTIKGINGCMFELEPIKKVEKMPFPVMVDSMMLERGFTEQEHINQ